MGQLTYHRRRRGGPTPTRRAGRVASQRITDAYSHDGGCIVQHGGQAGRQAPLARGGLSQWWAEPGDRAAQLSQAAQPARQLA